MRLLVLFVSGVLADVAVHLQHPAGHTYSEEEAREFARVHGFVYKREVVPGHFLFTEPSTRLIKREELGEDVKWFERQRVTPRYTRSLTRRQSTSSRGGGEGGEVEWNDPMWGDQWYLQNTGQNALVKGNDIGVTSVWKQGITGKGVVVGVLDDGIDYTHPDISANFVSFLSDKGKLTRVG